jgi:hypothetical protein
MKKLIIIDKKNFLNIFNSKKSTYYFKHHLNVNKK